MLLKEQMKKDIATRKRTNGYTIECRNCPIFKECRKPCVGGDIATKFWCIYNPNHAEYIKNAEQYYLSKNTHLSE